MIDLITEQLIQSGVLGCVCLFFMWKDAKKDNKIIESLDKIAIIINERIPPNRGAY